MQRGMNALGPWIGGAVLGTVLAVGGMMATAGDLDPPPGPVSPTFKTLEDVEPRIAINAANTPGNAQYEHVITQPGSYYLTGNLTAGGFRGGILVEADGVTIDLNGHAMSQAVGFGVSGISALNQTDLTVRNGTIRGFLLGDGIQAGDRARIDGVRVSDNGSGIFVGADAVVTACHAAGNSVSGIRVGTGSAVKDCVSAFNALDGFIAESASAFSGCVSRNNGGDGFSGGSRTSVTGCIATGNGGVGFLLTQAGSVTGCTAESNDLNGIVTGTGGIVEKSVARLNGGNGIVAGSGAAVRDCVAASNSGIGISVSSGAVVRGCASSFSGAQGIAVSSGCIVRDNAAYQNRADGIRCTGDCRVTGNMCDNNGSVSGGDGAGILATGSDNHIASNHMTDNDRGIEVTTGGNLIVANAAAGHGPGNAFVIAPGNDLGTIRTSPIGAGPWDNFEY